MARYSVAERSTNAGSTTLPLFSLYASASVALKVREIGIVNSTATAAAYCLRRFSATGTQGTALTECEYDEAAPAPTGTAFNSHSVTPTITAGYLRTCTLGAATGAAMIWTFGDTGLVIPAGTGNGIGVLVYTGTGQIVDFWIDWDE
jgi:hypothetical protein